MSGASKDDASYAELLGWDISAMKSLKLMGFLLSAAVGAVCLVIYGDIKVTNRHQGFHSRS
jgi:branched-subunit amino acid ABC-type transport system permease component